MMNGLCHSGYWGSLGNFGVGGWVGLILNLVFWVGLIVGLTLLVVWAIKRARALAPIVPSAAGEPTAGVRQTANEILQAQYARGEINREQYKLRKQEFG